MEFLRTETFKLTDDETKAFETVIEVLETIEKQAVDIELSGVAINALKYIDELYMWYSNCACVGDDNHVNE